LALFVNIETNSAMMQLLIKLVMPFVPVYDRKLSCISKFLYSGMIKYIQEKTL